MTGVSFGALLLITPFMALALAFVYSGVNAVRETWWQWHLDRTDRKNEIARWKEARDAVSR